MYLRTCTDLPRVHLPFGKSNERDDEEGKEKKKIVVD